MKKVDENLQKKVDESILMEIKRREQKYKHENGSQRNPNPPAQKRSSAVRASYDYRKYNIEAILKIDQIRKENENEDKKNKPQVPTKTPNQNVLRSDNSSGSSSSTTKKNRPSPREMPQSREHDFFIIRLKNSKKIKKNLKMGQKMIFLSRIKKKSC